MFIYYVWKPSSSDIKNFFPFHRICLKEKFGIYCNALEMFFPFRGPLFITVWNFFLSGLRLPLILLAACSYTRIATVQVRTLFKGSAHWRGVVRRPTVQLLFNKFLSDVIQTKISPYNLSVVPIYGKNNDSVHDLESVASQTSWSEFDHPTFHYEVCFKILHSFSSIFLTKQKSLSSALTTNSGKMIFEKSVKVNNFFLLFLTCRIYA